MIREGDVERMAALAGLRVDPAFVAGVLRALETLLAQGALLTAAPIAAEVEPAPVFRP